MLKEILLSEKPSKLIRLNKDNIFELIPELKICDGFNQHNDYHQYDILEHILHVLDEVENNYILKIAALFHDIGKPDCYILDENGVGHFYGHWNTSNEIFNKYIDMFDLKNEEVKLINNLIFYHDLGINNDNIDNFKDVFKENMHLLISLKKADILAQNKRYYYRLEELDNIVNQLDKINKK